MTSLSIQDQHLPIGPEAILEGRFLNLLLRVGSHLSHKNKVNRWSETQTLAYFPKAAVTEKYFMTLFCKDFAYLAA